MEWCHCGVGTILNTMALQVETALGLWGWGICCSLLFGSGTRQDLRNNSIMKAPSLEDSLSLTVAISEPPSQTPGTTDASQQHTSWVFQFLALTLGP